MKGVLNISMNKPQFTRICSALILSHCWILWRQMSITLLLCINTAYRQWDLMAAINRPNFRNCDNGTSDAPRKKTGALLVSAFYDYILLLYLILMHFILNINFSAVDLWSHYRVAVDWFKLSGANFHFCSYHY